MAETRPDMERVREMFRGHDLRCTRQRELVYGALAATNSHPTAEELLNAVRAADESLSLATVYNTLDALVECGLARRVAGVAVGGPCRFDADMSPHVHVATRDGRVMDLPADLSERVLGAVEPGVLREVEERMGVRVAGLSVQVVAG